MKPAEFDALVETEIEASEKLVKAAGLQAELSERWISVTHFANDRTGHGRMT